MKYPDDFIGKVIEGDSLSVMREMPDKCVDLVFTSPPYNLVREGSGGSTTKFPSMDNRKGDWYDDEMPEDEYQAWQTKVLTECVRVCRGSVFYNHKIRYAHARRGAVYNPWDWVSKFPIWCEITWDRCGAQGGNSGRYLLADEKIYQIGAPAHWDGAKGLTNIWRERPVIIPGHVCPFPVGLPSRAIATTTSEGMVILDPFMGSGQTAIAANNHNRKWVGIERNPKYCDIARNRIAAEQAQGKLF